MKVTPSISLQPPKTDLSFVGILIYPQPRPCLLVPRILGLCFKLIRSFPYGYFIAFGETISAILLVPWLF